MFLKKYLNFCWRNKYIYVHFLFAEKMINKETPENTKALLAAFLEWYHDLYGNEWFVKNQLPDAPVEKLSKGQSSHGTRDQSKLQQIKNTPEK